MMINAILTIFPLLALIIIIFYKVSPNLSLLNFVPSMVNFIDGLPTCKLLVFINAMRHGRVKGDLDSICLQQHHPIHLYMSGSSYYPHVENACMTVSYN